jgi:hypothetical protein
MSRVNPRPAFHLSSLIWSFIWLLAGVLAHPGVALAENRLVVDVWEKVAELAPQAKGLSGNPAAHEPSSNPATSIAGGVADHSRMRPRPQRQ